MSIAKFCFDGSLILPITPETFKVSSGIRIETINIHAIGDIRIAGYPTLDSISISGIFPANRYSFAVTDDITPYKPPCVCAVRTRIWCGLIHYGHNREPRLFYG